jgi:hypothetical protein
MTHMKIDWEECAAVETVPGKMSGQPVIRGTRVRPEDLPINRDQGVEWLARGHGIPGTPSGRCSLSTMPVRTCARQPTPLENPSRPKPR